MKKTIFKISIIIAAFFAGGITHAGADTHYVRKTGSGSACTLAAPCLTIAAGLNAMSGGDTLVIGDGTYSENITSADIPAGSSGSWTKIKAENLHGVTVVGYVSVSNVGGSSSANPAYTWIDGLRINGNSSRDTVVEIVYASFVKLTRCAVYGGRDAFNTAVVDVGQSSDVLIEENWAWGAGRYKFINYWTNRTVFRRNVARLDSNLNTGLQASLFTNYDSVNGVFQNNIALDSDNAYTGAGLYGGYYFENKDDHAADTTMTYEGNILLNVNNGTYSAGIMDRLSGTHTFNNQVIYTGPAMQAEKTSAINAWGSTGNVVIWSVNHSTGELHTITRAYTSKNISGNTLTLTLSSGVNFAYLQGETRVFNPSAPNTTVVLRDDVNTGATTLTLKIFENTSGYQAELGPSSESAPHIARLNHWTAGGLTGTYAGGNGWDAGGVGVTITGYDGHISDNTVKNSIFFNNNSYGVADWTVSSYNAFFGNGAATGGSYHTPAIGTGSLTTTNPLSNGLRYLPRIENGSTLKTAGEGGAQMGAEIIYKMGTAGTLYGEPGYNTLTSEPLWPFPNEDLIKSDMASYSGNVLPAGTTIENAVVGINGTPYPLGTVLSSPVTVPAPLGARGFAAGTSMDGSPQTLTKYIWEQLGNQIPAEIYGGGDTTPPASPTGLSVS
jgi:hypothetical protein